MLTAGPKQADECGVRVLSDEIGRDVRIVLLVLRVCSGDQLYIQLATVMGSLVNHAVAE
jgi:hypothetical protein